jgi:PEP-CTERM putative exosortase interaction domain
MSAGQYRGIRGGGSGLLIADGRGALPLSAEYKGLSASGDFGSNIGIRLAMIPEPSTGLLVSAGLLGLVGRRKGRH